MSANKLVLGDSFNALAKQVENLVEKDASAYSGDSSFRYAPFGMTGVCEEQGGGGIGGEAANSTARTLPRRGVIPNEVRNLFLSMTCSDKDGIKTSFPPHLKQQNNLSSNELIINLINKNN